LRQRRGQKVRVERFDLHDSLRADDTLAGLVDLSREAR
jgi:hypothetical protein